ncbi:MAG: transcription elongation factor GreA [Parcubacteria group bacterium]|nr:transcription elongation factor GreA [Parcubacteria group bacterium]
MRQSRKSRILWMVITAMSQGHFITQDRLNQLQKELEDLKTNKRREVADKLAVAVQMGDLSENAAYEDAKEEQGVLERRIAELSEIISNAKVIGSGEAAEDGVVRIGSNIKVKLNGSKDEFAFEIAGPQEADPAAGRISYESPLGRGFLGKRVGEKVEIKVPKGILKYTILELK